MLLVGNGRVITREENQPYIEHGCIAIEKNLIVEVGETSSLRGKHPGATFLDARGNMIMPGMINTHMHLYSTFARGLALKDAPPQNFTEILERLWWRLDKTLTLDDIYYSAMPIYIDCIKNGTTTLFDHHASPGAVAGSLFTLAKAAQAAGIRSCLCYEVSDRDGAAVLAAGIQENLDFICYSQREQSDMLRGMFGLHASLTLSDRSLEQCAKANATQAGFHVHVAEAAVDVADALAKSGNTPVARLAQFGLLGSKSIAAHCVHVNDSDIQILQQTGVKVVHNPESNMGNAVGCAPVLAMMGKEITVGLGTDGYTSDMFEAYKVANMLHKHQQGNPSVAWGEAPTMLFVSNRDIAKEYFPRPLGRLAAGCYADIIVVDYTPPTPLTGDNVNGHILFGMSGRSVVSTIVNGKVLMENRQLKGLDEQEVCAKARELAKKLWSRF